MKIPGAALDKLMLESWALERLMPTWFAESVIFSLEDGCTVYGPNGLMNCFQQLIFCTGMWRQICRHICGNDTITYSEQESYSDVNIDL